jgi:hypothetical protein
MKEIKILSENELLNDQDMNALRGGISVLKHHCYDYYHCGSYSFAVDNM